MTFDDPKRPPRLFPDDDLKTDLYLKQNGRCSITGKRLPSIYHCQVHHDPPLGIRPVNEDGTDYIPPQLDPNHLFLVVPDAHDEDTNGPRDLEKGHMLPKRHTKSKVSKSKRVRKKWGEHKKGQATKTFGKRKAGKLRPPDRRQLLKYL